jgi:hypothetical protein
MKCRVKSARPDYESLRIEAAKLRALAYLIEHQSDGGVVPLDQDEILWGLGMLLTRSISRVRRIAIRLEEEALLSAKATPP